MAKIVEPLLFDSKLFGFKVGRIEVDDSDVEAFTNKPQVEDILKHAYVTAYRLIYVFGPTRSPVQAAQFTPPGILVDVKTTYIASLFKFDYANLCAKAFSTTGIRIRKYNDTQVSAGLRDLAIASGVYSRFKVDEGVPVEGFEGMFEAWITNSVNRSIADEVFVAYKSSDESFSDELGFITVKRRGNNVNIGLLAVSSRARRTGIAFALMSRAVIWALEELGSDATATVNVVTQGNNKPACAFYEHFGFKQEILQDVYHTWLPDHLTEELPRTDQGPIPFCKQHLTGQEISYVTQVISSGLDSAGNFTMQCAARIQTLLGEASDRVVMVPSGTAALEMAALLCELQPGDEVILPSYTFSSTANCFVLRGAVPVFVDIRPDTLNINEALIEAGITLRTKAICAVHYAGIPCEMDTICSIAQKHNLCVIEDAAQGFMSTYKGRPLGTIGDFGCFSFHYTKNIVCGEGGALSVNRSSSRASRAMVMWEKGTNRYDYMMGKIDKYHWVDVGSSYVPNELSCAVLWAQLERQRDIQARRHANFTAYAEGLREIASQGAFRIPHIPEGCVSNAHIFFVVLPTMEIREYYEVELKNRGVSAFSHYLALHSAPAGIKYGRWVGSMINTDAVQHTLLRLPVWADMDAAQVQFVVDAVRHIASNLPAHLAAT